MNTLELINKVLDTDFTTEQEAREVLIQKEFTKIYRTATHDFVTTHTEFIGRNIPLRLSYESLQLVRLISESLTSTPEKQRIEEKALASNVKYYSHLLSGFKYKETLSSRDIASCNGFNSPLLNEFKRLGVEPTDLTYYHSNKLNCFSPSKMLNLKGFIDNYVFTEYALDSIEKSTLSLEGKVIRVETESDLHDLYIGNRYAIVYLVLGINRFTYKDLPWFSDDQTKYLEKWHGNRLLPVVEDVLSNKSKSYYETELNLLRTDILDADSRRRTDFSDSMKDYVFFKTFVERSSVLLYNALGLSITEKDMGLFSEVSFLMYLIKGIKRKREFL